MRLMEGIKSSFVSGMILIAPMVLTLYVLRILVNWSFQFLNPIVAGTKLTDYTANVEIAAQLVAAVLILLAITFLGFLAKRRSGQYLFGTLGRVVNVIPLFNTIYMGVRQVADSLSDRKTDYESVVLVEYPRENVYSIGLVTGDGPTPANDYVGEDLYNVFLPNSPNPTGGRLVLLPADEVHEIDMPVRRGMRLLVTTGIGEADATEAGVDPSAIPD